MQPPERYFNDDDVDEGASLLNSTNDDDEYNDDAVVVIRQDEQRLRLIKTICMSGIFFCLGCEPAIFGPTIIDLRDILHCTYEELTRTLFAKGIGTMIGSLIGGYLADRFRPHIDWQMSGALFIMGVTLMVVPWAPSLLFLGFIQIIMGVVYGSLGGAANSLVLAMWGDGSAKIMQFLHSFFGIGFTATLLFTAPFLSQNGTASNSTDVTQSQPTRIYIPYAVIGSICVISSIILIPFAFRKLSVMIRSPLTKRTWRQLLSPRSCARGHCCFGVHFLAVLVLAYVALVAKDTSLQTMMVPLAVETHLQFTKTAAALLPAAYFAAYTAGRITAAIVTKWLRIQIVLILAICAHILIVALMCVPHLQTSTAFWILIPLYGFFTGPYYPAGLTWASQYIEITALVIALIDVGVGIGSAIISWLSGYIYDYVGPFYTLHMCLISSIALLIFAIYAQTIAYCHNRRNRSQPKLE